MIYTMGSSKRKSAFILGCALLLSTDSSYAANNTVTGVSLSNSEDGITANVSTQNEYSTPIKATKSGQYYNIILPNTVKNPGASCQSGDLAESCRITTVNGADGSYTKIQIKVPESVKVTAMSSVGMGGHGQAFNEETEQELLNELEDQQNFEEDNTGHSEESFDGHGHSEDSDFEEPNFEDSEETAEPVVDMLPEPAPEPQPSTYKPIDEPSLTANHLQEILYGFSWIFGIILVCLIIYYLGRDKIKQQMGDMDIDISDNKKKVKKEETTENKAKEKEAKPKKQKPRTETIDLSGYSNSYVPPEMDHSAFAIEDEPVIDIDSLYVQPTPPRTPVQETVVNRVEEEDLDDFLNSFVDDEEDSSEPESQSVSYTEPSSEQPIVTEEEEENLTHTELDYTEDDSNSENNSKDIDDNEEILSVEDLLEGEDLGPQVTLESNEDIIDEDDDISFENPIENLIDDVLATEGMSFSEADVDFIQKQLQVDVTPELLDEFRLATQANESTAPLMTLEMFDEQYPSLSDKTISELLKDGIKFNAVDTQVIHDLMTNLEISDDSIVEARIRKEQEEQANIDYYQNEADFAFTLVKPQDMDKQDEIIVLDENYYPDLDEVDFSGDSILNEFTLIQPEKPNYTEELDLGTTTLEDLGITELPKPLISRELEEELEQASTVHTELLDDTSIEVSSEISDSIDEQFKALGVDFSDETSQEQEEFEHSPTEDTVENFSIEPTIEQKTTIGEDFNSTKAEIYAKCSIDESTKLYITQYEGKNILVGMKNDTIKPLYEFTDAKIPSSISTRIAETVDEKTRYIVRADKFKSVIEVSEDDIELVLVL